ncbi:sigma-54-dependent Fis family transcriptional regulator [Cereibacter changlensis]|uniref:Sigma-54-dependent Fis family transcriptional regulator n=1 Tax=Cereibacter changlensis TaxID=402884 RepID=A0A4V5NLP7_9RHOB|nr:sigma-54 dependent transcriptional regulator [Cereibacter changlensis]TKA95727.1 sigma-54-dependent Fis family transcriptional regulator [Cereibacter changlensis]
MTDTPLLVRLVDDDPDLLAAQVQSLTLRGFRVEAFSGAAEALRGMTRDYPGVVLTDVRMPQIDGMELFRRLRAMDPDLPVILLTGHGDVPMAVRALTEGVYDFLTKPVALDDLMATLRRATGARALVLENRMLRRMQAPGDGAAELLGDSLAMTHLRETVARVAEAGVDALVIGGSGVGKEAVARQIHRQSPRRARAFVHVNCATLDESRFDADFLGAEPGVRVGQQPRAGRVIGRIERAHRGTLFLDQVEALSPALQARLHGVIEAGEVWPLGAEAARPLDLRVIAATQVDLGARVREGRFRADLFYRLGGISLLVPPLTERREDVPLLFRHFLLAACARLKLPVPLMTPGLKARLATHDWPGNVRELQHFAERQALGLAPEEGGAEGPEPTLAESVAAFEAELIRDALRQAGGNASRAMLRLGLPRKTFYDKLTRHAIRAEAFRGGEGA